MQWHPTTPPPPPPPRYTPAVLCENANVDVLNEDAKAILSEDATVTVSEDAEDTALSEDVSHFPEYSLVPVS